MIPFVIAATLAAAPVQPPAGDTESVERLNRATQAQLEARDARKRAAQGDYQQQRAAYEAALRQNQAAAAQAAAAQRDYEAARAANAAAMASWQRDAARRLASAEPVRAASREEPVPAAPAPARCRRVPITGSRLQTQLICGAARPLSDDPLNGMVGQQPNWQAGPH